MPIRQLRTFLNFILVILATLAAKHLYDQWHTQKGSRALANEVIEICALPALPEDIVIRHADIMMSDDRELVDTSLTLTGPTEVVDGWLDQVDSWVKKRPGHILNYQLRESERSSRVDFSAEVFLLPES